MDSDLRRLACRLANSASIARSSHLARPAWLWRTCLCCSKVVCRPTLSGQRMESGPREPPVPPGPEREVRHGSRQGAAYHQTICI